MEQIIEFIGNHTLLFIALVVTLGMLIFTEYTRFAGGVKMLSPFAATQKLNSGEAVFLDVRDESEYKNGHVLNARNLPVGQIDKRLHEFEKHKDKDIVVYCDNGMRTSRAAARLRKNGFKQLYSVAGGLSAWEKANLPVVTR